MLFEILEFTFLHITTAIPSVNDIDVIDKILPLSTNSNGVDGDVKKTIIAKVIKHLGIGLLKFNKDTANAIVLDALRPEILLLSSNCNTCSATS